MKYITISGPARSGKDFIAKKIQEQLTNCKCIALADKLKEYICKIFNISLEDLNKFKNSKEPFTKNSCTMREILQRLGTDIFVDNVSKMYWVDEVKKIKGFDYIIVTDVRFKHEIESFENSFKIKVKSNEEILERDHKSERDLDNFQDYDFIIDNSEKKDISEIINKIVKKIKE